MVQVADPASLDYEQRRSGYDKLVTDYQPDVGPASVGSDRQPKGFSGHDDPRETEEKMRTYVCPMTGCSNESLTVCRQDGGGSRQFDSFFLAHRASYLCFGSCEMAGARSSYA